jgi:hypothetical protein
MDPAAGRTAFADPASFATTLVAAAVDEFGGELTGWDPATVQAAVAEWLGFPVPEAAFDRLMAGLFVLADARFYTDWEAFARVAPVLSGALFTDDPAGPVAAEQAAWAITEALVLAPPPRDDPGPFSDGVRAYLGAVLDAEGFAAAPDVLAIAVRDDAARRRRLADLDPQAAEDARRVEVARCGEVEAVVRDGLRRLIDQLAALPLEHGSARALAERLAGHRPESDEE